MDYCTYILPLCKTFQIDILPKTTVCAQKKKKKVCQFAMEMNGDGDFILPEILIFYALGTT